MLEVSGSRPDGAQEKKENKCVRSLGNREEKERKTERKGEKNGARGRRESAKRQRAIARFCLQKQSAYIINNSACIINAWGYTEIFPNTVVHYSMAHEPVGIVQPFLNDIRTVSIRRNRPGQFYTKQHSLQTSCLSAAADSGFPRKALSQILIKLCERQ